MPSPRWAWLLQIANLPELPAMSSSIIKSLRLSRTFSPLGSYAKQWLNKRKDYVRLVHLKNWPFWRKKSDLLYSCRLGYNPHMDVSDYPWSYPLRLKKYAWFFAYFFCLSKELCVSNMMHLGLIQAVQSKGSQRHSHVIPVTLCEAKLSASNIIDPHDSLNIPMKHNVFGMRHANLVGKRVHISNFDI